MSKLTMLAAAGAGYVLGARAGRERYDQIAATAGKAWRDPRVQKRKDQAAETAKQTASTAAQQASQAAGSAKESVQDKVGSGSGATDGPTIPSTNAIPDSGVTPGDVAQPSFPTDPGQPFPGEPGSPGAAR